MSYREKDIMKAHCDEIGVVLTVLFGIGAAAISIYVILGIMTLCHPFGDFSVNLADTGNGMVGLVTVKGGSEMEFARNVLNTNALSKPKAAYGIGLFVYVLIDFLVLFILWNLRMIFKNIEKHGTPFMTQNSKAIFRIGILIMVLCHVKSAVLPLLCALFGIGGAGTGSIVNLTGLFIGGMVICLSYIFEYGTSLQRESDETL